jgi:hypothetical protein
MISSTPKGVGSPVCVIIWLSSHLVQANIEKASSRLSREHWLCPHSDTIREIQHGFNP